MTQAALLLLRQLSGPEKLHRVRRLLHVLEQTLGMCMCSPPCVHVDGGRGVRVYMCVHVLCFCMSEHGVCVHVFQPQANVGCLSPSVSLYLP